MIENDETSIGLSRLEIIKPCKVPEIDDKLDDS